MQSIVDFNFKDKRALVRVDYNVPMSDDGKILDNSRIKSSLETINKILDDGGSVVLISHLGSPQGQRNMKFSLAPIAKELEAMLDRTVVLQESLDIAELDAEIVLLENIRFYRQETLCEADFAQHLATLGDVFIFEAFSVSHRSHASVKLLPKFFQDKFLGLHTQKELKIINKLLRSPIKPFTLVLGGTKIFDKLQAVYKLLPQVDTLVIGGGIANTFLEVKHGEVGKSIVEKNEKEYVLDLIQYAKSLNVCILEPVDFVVIKNHSNEPLWPEAVNKNCVEHDHVILDIGPETQEIFYNLIANSNSVLWSGPMGFVENSLFSMGSQMVAKGIVQVVKNGGCSLIGGGDTGGFVSRLPEKDDCGFVSCGGTALLNYIAEPKQPGFVAFNV